MELACYTVIALRAQLVGKEKVAKINGDILKIGCQILSTLAKIQSNIIYSLEELVTSRRVEVLLILKVWLSDVQPLYRADTIPDVKDHVH